MMELPSLFRLAKKISYESDYRVRLGAVLVKHGKPISVGYNKIRYHNEYCWPNDATVHAEMSALLASGKEHVDNSVMIIYREHGIDGLPLLARPCKHCMKALKEFGVKKIYYTTDEYPFFEVEKL